MGGAAFLSAETVLPIIVASLGGSSWMVSIVPILMVAGLMLPSVFTTHWFERRKEVKPVIMLFSMLQRLPYLIAGLSLLFIGEARPGLTLAIVLSAPFVSGLMGGITISAFFELYSRVVPANRRNSSLAVRYVVAGSFGVVAGLVVKFILEAFPGTVGYGILHLITFSLMMLSYALFCTIKEVNRNHRPEDSPTTYRAYLHSLIPLIKSQPHLLRFILMRSTGVSFLLIIPFLGLHAMNETGATESFVGLLLVAHMIGGMAGNVTAGIVGDRVGSKIPLLVAKVLFLIMSVAVIFNTSTWGFYLIYFLFGYAFYTDHICATTLMTTLAPKRRRPTFMAIVSFLSVPSLVIATILASVLHETTGSIVLSCVIVMILMTVSLGLLLGIPEPTKAQA